MTRAESFSTTLLEQRSRLSPLVAGGSLLQKRLYERSSVSETGFDRYSKTDICIIYLLIYYYSYYYYYFLGTQVKRLVFVINCEPHTRRIFGRQCNSVECQWQP